MALDDFIRKMRAMERERDARSDREFYEHVDRGLKEQGHPGIEVAMGVKAAPDDPVGRLTAVLTEIAADLGEDPEVTLRRAVGLLRGAVACAKSGGHVEFVRADGVRLRLKLPVVGIGEGKPR